MIKPDYYRQPVAWTGRIDGTAEELLRWHQRIIPVNLLTGALPVLKPHQQGVVFLGFASDEGVRRNQGRVGAAEGPAALRLACSNFPVHFDSELVLADAGDIICKDNQLEEAQHSLSAAVLSIRKAGYLPVLLGGGHEITYGHAHGIYQHLTGRKRGEKLGLLNMDAHFDLRMTGTEGSTSGTSFWQLAQDCNLEGVPFHYLALGIQANSNTQQLFRIAGDLEVQYVDADAFHLQDKPLVHAAINQFLRDVDHVYLTIDLDVFSAAFAPGVSATAYNGIRPDGLFLECYRNILQSGKLAGIDIAELNPSLDVDNRTAKLGAGLLFEMISNLHYH
ncbi:formimidoylglutamase [Chitinophaga rhizophila]|uniref:Formimidoylglutamase n=1 Tax=Chitinophaga rhizophila TaxID=2866212 RepID=A0ABS7G8E6_9BACT|nr:formimidoylglutamase [Chitinophaga rhizophila]MBW8683937.1 formimidoylglutamase [Chitinophaga rhizophila]